MAKEAAFQRAEGCSSSSSGDDDDEANSVPRPAAALRTQLPSPLLPGSASPGAEGEAQPRQRAEGGAKALARPSGNQAAGREKAAAGFGARLAGCALARDEAREPGGGGGGERQSVFWAAA